jgi:hypothetical protein
MSNMTLAGLTTNRARTHAPMDHMSASRP